MNKPEFFDLFLSGNYAVVCNNVDELRDVLCFLRANGIRLSGLSNAIADNPECDYGCSICYYSNAGSVFSVDNNVDKRKPIRYSIVANIIYDSTHEIDVPSVDEFSDLLRSLF